MQEEIDLKARWGARKETVEECAVRMLSFLKQLADCDEVFAQQWLKCARSRAEAMAGNLQKVDLSLETLEDIISRGRVRNKLNGSVMEPRGFMPGRFWNGNEIESAHVYIECGAYPDPRFLPGPNVVWIELPNNDPAAKRLFRLKKLVEIMKTVVISWDPDWARVSTFQMDTTIYEENGYQGQMVGWFTYISDRYGPLPPLPKDCAVERVGELGNLVIIASIKERLTVSNPAHVAAIRRLSDALKRAGMLAPIPPVKPSRNY